LATSGMQADETLSAQPIRLPVTAPEGIQASFDGQLTYFKGATVLRQFEAFVGARAWRDFIHGYIAKHLHGNASGPELFAEVGQTFGAAVGQAFEQDFTRPGVALVDLKVECTAKEIVPEPYVRSLPAGVAEDADDHRTYAVPVCVRYGDASHSDRACVLGKPIDVAYCPTWFIANADAIGYYRSKYDPALATALLDPTSAIARQAKPTSAERRMIVADLAAMVRRDELPIERALSLVAKLIHDRDPKVAAGADFVPLHTGGLPDDLFAAVRRWSVATFGPLAHQLGWQRAKGDSDDVERLRVAVLDHVAFHDPATRAQAEKLADKWLEDRTGLPDDLVDLALSAAAFKGTAARFDKILAAAKAAKGQKDRTRLLGALGGFTDPALAARARELVVGTDFDTRDAIVVLEIQLERRDTREGTWTWLQQHLDEVLARQRDDQNSWLLGQIAGTFCDAPHRAAVAAFLTPRADKIAGARALVTRGLEQVDHCIAEVAREMPALQHFFIKR
ncbi:MAG TPA: M1 family metallopeptidase, partial [Kofleriaceae bacterium]|nr:M1 family metallopeptidase [Kofleriaceae bacterium]